MWTMLKRRIRCLTGAHEFVQLTTDDGDVFEFCAWCGVNESGRP